MRKNTPFHEGRFLMKKKLFLLLTAALFVSMSLAACNKNTVLNGTTTERSSMAYSGISSTEEEAETTAANTEPSAAPSVTPSTGDAQQGKKDPPEAPTVPVKNDDSTPAAMEKFSSLSTLKTLAGRHVSAAGGYEMMRAKKLVVPTGAFYGGTLKDQDYQGSFNDKALSYGFAFTLPGQGGTEYSVTYSILQKAYPSHNIRDAITASVINRCIPVTAGGVTYYYDTGSIDGDDIVSVYYFYGDYCVTTVFYNPPTDDTGNFSVKDMERRGFFKMATASL